MIPPVKLALTFTMALGLLCVAGCGVGSTPTPTEGHSGQIGGHTGGMHALGENPDAEVARLKKAAPSTKARPQQLPGR